MQIFFSVTVALLLIFPGPDQLLSNEWDIEGQWHVRKSLEAEGKWVDETDAKFLVVRQNGLQTITRDGQPFSKRKYSIDPSTTPKSLTFDDVENAEIKYGSALGIYEINGNILKVAIASDPKKRATDRPKDFSEDGTKWIYIYERIATGESPKTLEEGLARMEQVLGRYLPDDQLEWRVPTVFEHKTRPNPSEPDILLVFDGLKVVGHPFREPEAFSFDEVWQWQRQVFDLTEDGKKKLTRTQRTHNVTRYSFTLNSGVWFVNGTMLTNGVHHIIGKSTFQGIVKWHTDGFEFVGSTSADRFYAAGGKFILGASHGTIRYTRTGDRLKIKTRFQPHHLAVDSEGNNLTTPDLKRPFGVLFDVEYQSEAVATER